MELLKLAPTVKDYLWGGTRLKTEFGISTALEKAAEGWMLSCHKDGACVVCNGPYQGKTLAEYIDLHGPATVGTNASRFDRFPVLIKLIDAADDLSVQVHPDNSYAMQTEGEPGKTEMWVILDCEPGASLIYGFSQPLSREELEQRVKNNTLLEAVNRVSVKKGDVIFIEAGQLHAIGKGILLAEIQQNSNTTYRIYDYDRRGADGKPRPLQIKKALEVTKREPVFSDFLPQGSPVKGEGYQKTLLAKCEYFTVYDYQLGGCLAMAADKSSFHSIVVLEGKAAFYQENSDKPVLSAKKGESVFVPAGTGRYTISGKAKLLFTRI